MEEDHKHVQMLPNGIKAASELLLAAKIFYQKLLDATTHPEDEHGITSTWRTS